MDLPTTLTASLRTFYGSCLIVLIGCVCAPGCRTLESPADLASALSASDSSSVAAIEPPPAPPITEPEPPVELTEDAWVVAIPQVDAAEDFPYRWQHSGLDHLLALPENERLDFAQFLTSDNTVVVGNAVIVLARAGDDTVDRCLIETIRNSDLKLPMRRAAAEALSLADTPVAAPALSELLDDFAISDDKATIPLQAELLRGLARHVDPSGSAYFAEALKSPETELRAAALYAFTINPSAPLPPQVVTMRSDSDPRVRAAVLACLAARRHPQTLEFSRAALTEFHRDVRLAAIAALGRDGSDESRTTLQRMLLHDPEAVRSAAITALATAGDDVTVFASAKDSSWQVRRSVARALARFPTPRAAAIARQLLADGSAEVRRGVLSAVDAWPLEQSGPIMLTAMAEAPQPTRKQAATLLAARWAPAARFTVDAPSDIRKLELSALQTAWTATYADVESRQAVEPPIAAAPSRPAPAASAFAPVAVQASYDATSEPATALAEHHTVLASAASPVDANTVAAALAQLVSEDVEARREAARALGDMADPLPLDAAATARICQQAMAETDPRVWCDLLRAVQFDTGEASLQMICAGASHTAADVRRLSCGYLGMRSDPRATNVLVRALSDPNRAVVRSAVESLGSCETLTDPTPIERLLAGDDKSLRVAAARTLAAHRIPTGSAALTALVRDDDAEVRRQAAAAMGSLRDTTYLPVLISALDDDLNVRIASLASLSQIVDRGPNAGGNDSVPPPLADQVADWKRWYATEGSRLAERIMPGVSNQ